MTDARSVIDGWLRDGRLDASGVAQALRIAGVTPGPYEWRRFAERLLTVLGAVLVACGAIFFIAANWQELSRYAKFALVEAAIIVAIVVSVRTDVDSAIGRAALAAASLLAGALLALVGQVYQTGADSYELFGAWALAILAWVAVAHQAALWVLWLGIVNVAIALYFTTAAALASLVFGGRDVLWALFIADAIALAAWEIGAAIGVRTLASRWAPRLIGTATGIAISLLAIEFVVERNTNAAAIIVFAAWLVAWWWAYRRRSVDLYMLAGAVLCTTIVATAALARQLRDTPGGQQYLLLALFVVACAGAGAWWLRRVGVDQRA